jgi:serine/threonine-protein kinase
VRPRGRRERAFDFCARHPWIAALASLLVVASVYGGVATLYAGFTGIARDHAEQAAFRAADFAAHRAAEVTALQFDRYKAAVEAAGRDPRVVRAALRPDSEDPSEACADLLAEHDGPSAGPFSHWFMFDVNGKMIGRSTPADSMGRVYAFRDYYKGAGELEKQGRRVAYVSRTYRSEGNGIFEVSISFTVHDEADRPIGLIVGALSTGSVLGSIQFDDRDMAGLTAALIAPRDRERSPDVIDREPVFIMHSGLGLGHVVPAHTKEMLDADLAGGGYMRVIPVRGTPFSVLVRVAFSEASAPAEPLQTSLP